MSSKRHKFTVSLCSVFILVSENRNGLRVREGRSGSDKKIAKPVRPGQAVAARGLVSSHIPHRKGTSSSQ